MPDYVLNVDELDGSVRYFSTDEATDTVRIWTQYDTAPLEEANTAAYNAPDHSARFSKLGDAQVMYKVGTIAPWEVQELRDRGILRGWKIEDEKAFNKWMMDPSFRKVRLSAPLKLGL